MKILYCSVQDKNTENLLVSPLKDWAPTLELLGYAHLHDLFVEFPILHHETTALVFFISKNCRIDTLLSHKDLLKDQKLFLIFPSSDIEGIKQAHLLYPRFIGYSDSDVHDLNAVLNKFLHNESRRNSGQLPEFPLKPFIKENPMIETLDPKGLTTRVKNTT